MAMMMSVVNWQPTGGLMVQVNFGTCTIMQTQILIMWQSFTRSAEGARRSRGEINKRKSSRNYCSGRPNQ